MGAIALEVPPVVAIGRKAIPDSNHPFIAPGPTDQRGGCPGLNSKSRIVIQISSEAKAFYLLSVMANYGYINRTGITDITEILWASQEMLGMGTDLVSALVGVLAISAIDPTT